MPKGAESIKSVELYLVSIHDMKLVEELFPRTIAMDVCKPEVPHWREAAPNH